MSKTQLKKEISNFDREQLIQLVLDLYENQKEAKAYLDFFLNPDVDKLSEKFQKSIIKEIRRGKYRVSKARISKIRQYLKDFASFDVGPEAEIKLMLFTLREALIAERSLAFTKPLVTGTAWIMLKVIEIADKNLMFDKVMSEVNTLLDSGVGSRLFIKYLQRQIETYNS